MASFDVVCCSLEPWDDVWRRNQFFARELLDLDPDLRLLFVEPPADVAWSAVTGRRASVTGLRQVGDTGRLWAFTPRKLAPRRIWPYVDRGLQRRVVGAARKLGFARPVAWVNDNTYAGLLAAGWPGVYDVTDDWLLSIYPPRELRRQQHNDAEMLHRAAEVVVCSPALAATRGRQRRVHLIPNGVDVAHFRTPQPRPADLPAGRIVLYTGSLVVGRLDFDLCVELARGVRDKATFTLVGPSSLTPDQEERLVRAGAVLVGARPYSSMPGYLQYADVLAVPHAINTFTESLDPIKARETLAVGRPTVTTPVAGMRDLADPVLVVPSESFVQQVVRLLDAPAVPPGPGPMPVAPASWTDRAKEFLAVIETASAAART